jgi:hypothetical protein
VPARSADRGQPRFAGAGARIRSASDRTSTARRSDDEATHADGLALTLAAASLAGAVPTAGASDGSAQPNCIGFFRANADPGTPVAGGNRQDPGATEGGLHLGDFARDAQPCG